MMHFSTYYRTFGDCFIYKDDNNFPVKKTRPAPVKPVTRLVKACMHRKTLCGRNH